MMMPTSRLGSCASPCSRSAAAAARGAGSGASRSSPTQSRGRSCGRADALAVEVHVRTGSSASSCGSRAVRSSRRAGPPTVHHRDGRRRRARSRPAASRAPRAGAARTARCGALDRPVPGVVRPHGELVDQQLAAGLEQLDRHHPDGAELARRAQLAMRLRLGGEPRSRPGAGASTSVQIPSAAPSRRPATPRISPVADRATMADELAIEGDALLDEDPCHDCRANTAASSASSGEHTPLPS